MRTGLEVFNSDTLMRVIEELVRRHGGKLTVTLPRVRGVGVESPLHVEWSEDFLSDTHTITMSMPVAARDDRGVLCR